MADGTQTSTHATTNVLFSKPVVGWTCIVIALVLLMFFGYAVFAVLPMLTRPPGFIDKYMEKASNLEGSYVTTLEYESFVIRTQGVQVAFGFIVGLLLGIFGMVLFAVGATDAYAAEGEYQQWKLSLKSTAPGLIVLLISGVVISLAVNKDVRRKFDATFEEGKTPRIISGGEQAPPRSNKGEDAPGKDN